MRDEGHSFEAVAKIVAVSTTSVRRWLDPDYKREDVKKDINLKQLGFNRRRGGLELDRDAMRLMALVPEDTRTPGEILMGDPLPGRSALDQKRQQQ